MWSSDIHADTYKLRPVEACTWIIVVDKLEINIFNTALYCKKVLVLQDFVKHTENDNDSAQLLAE